jgi:DNA polymerase III sliding clamp (beta) subunit (PCNA family)
MRIRAEILRRAIAIARVVCDARAYLPQLACGRLVCDGETATLSTTDLETWVDVVFPAEGQLAPCLLELAPLAKLVPDRGNIALDVDGAEYWLTDGPRRLRAPSVAVDAWPESRPDKGAITAAVHYDGPVLLAALEHAERAVSTDATRPFLHSVLLDDAGRVVATDGHRAHWTEDLPPAPGWRLPGAMVRAMLGLTKHGKSIGARDAVRPRPADLGRRRRAVGSAAVLQAR